MTLEVTFDSLSMNILGWIFRTAANIFLAIAEVLK